MNAKRQDKKTMCEFSAYVAFNKATNGQTDIGKTRTGETNLKISYNVQTRSLRGRELFDCDL